MNTFFGYSVPFQKTSETSREAAVSMETHHEPLEEKVFRALKASTWGLTDEEIDTLLQPPSTLRPRRVKLLHDGRIREIGKRPTKSGRLAVVWKDAPLDPCCEPDFDYDTGQYVHEASCRGGGRELE